MLGLMKRSLIVSNPHVYRHRVLQCQTISPRSHGPSNNRVIEEWVLRSLRLLMFNWQTLLKTPERMAEPGRREKGLFNNFCS
jgi:hypothetical protein